MSLVRDYLEMKATLGPKEWLRREARETHPEILSLVREFEDNGGFYDDDTERFVNDRIGDLPPHVRHGVERHPLVAQLGHEVYIAKSCLRNEKAQVALDEAISVGFLPLEDVDLEDGGRYTIRLGVRYCGQDVPSFGSDEPVRAKREGSRFVFLPRGAKSRYFTPSGPALIRAGWA